MKRRLWFSDAVPGTVCDCCGQDDHQSSAHHDPVEALKIVNARLIALGNQIAESSPGNSKMRAAQMDARRWCFVALRAAQKARRNG